MTENNYNKLIDAICELVNLAWDSTSKEEFERLDNGGADIIDCLEKLQQFEAIGTIEEFKALKEKNVAKKPIGEYTQCKCSVCGRRVRSGRGSSSFVRDNFCQRCGQKLDWQ